jgi:hypothetical protein
VDMWTMRCAHRTTPWTTLHLISDIPQQPHLVSR